MRVSTRAPGMEISPGAVVRCERAWELGAWWLFCQFCQLLTIFGRR
jgi:hypothetical protein